MHFLKLYLQNAGRFISAGVLGCILALVATHAEGGTIVVSNRTGAKIDLQVGGESYAIASGEVLPIRSETSQTVRFAKSVQPSYTVDPNAIYFLGASSPSRIELYRIGLGGDATTSSIFESDLLAGSQSSKEAGGKGIVTIPVKVLVDDDDVATTEEWQRRLRVRMEAASAIFERHCFVRFEIVAMETWKTNDEMNDFDLTLTDFERKVRPGPARIAIGFTSQYRIMLGRAHLGGTRGPMHSHILVREWSNRINGPERLEVLVHELGHFLGAVHTPEKDSVMRPVLGDKQARAVGFRIGFDPLNTLAMCLVSESMQGGRLNRFTDLRLPAQLELHKLYGDLAKADPQDPAAAQYVGILEQAGIEPLVQGAKLAVAGLTATAKQNAKDAKASDDGLTDLYVRQAAAFAGQSSARTAPRAFLLALGMGLDRTAALREHRLIGPFCNRIESESDKNSRLELMGVPTAHGKHELSRHFAIGAGLTAMIGTEAAERACLALQLGESSSPGQFSPSIYQADLAGIVFAYRVLAGELRLVNLAKEFQIAEHVPHPDEPDRLLSPSDFSATYGSVSDPRFRKLRMELGAPLRKLSPKQ